MKQIRQFIREIIPVIVGILVALLINNWNEDRKDRKYLNQIFSSMQEELEESYADIAESLPKQQALVDTIRAYLDDEDIPLFEVILKADGFYGPTITTNAWQAISNSRIELIEYKMVSILSDIHATKGNIERKEEVIMEHVYDNLKSTHQDQKEVLLILLIDIMSSQQSLQLEIDEFFEINKPTTKD